MNHYPKRHPLQSPRWATFRKKWGNRVVDFDGYNITFHKIPFSPFQIGAFIKGPKPTSELIQKLKTLAKKERAIFIKLEPNYPLTIDGQALKGGEKQELTSLLKKNGAVPGKTLFTPSTFWVDLTQSEDKLLSGFSSKTRYNIKVAQKKGVEVNEDNSDLAFKRYLELTSETAKRQGFYAHTKKYHQLMWEVLHQEMVQDGQPPIARLLTARYNQEIVTTWIVFVYENTLYYPYGASSDKYKNVMANNLMMWEAIKYGKKEGCTIFDLWGREEGKGFTRFKEGYNPQVVEFLGTWDLVINKPLYYLYRLAEMLRWIILRVMAKTGLTRNRL